MTYTTFSVKAAQQPQQLYLRDFLLQELLTRTEQRASATEGKRLGWLVT